MEFIIAKIRFALPDDMVSGYWAEALAPFKAQETGNVNFEVRYHPDIVPVGELHPLERFAFAEDDADCTFGIDDGGNYLLHILPHDTAQPAARFRISNDGREVLCDHSPRHAPSTLRFGLWIAFNITAVRRNTVAIHSSTIVYRGQAVLMLGESGTGKSTHTRLWREHIEGARLLNDDSPIVCAHADRTPDCHGSAWSGKTPCYINAHAPIRAFVRLSQAPHNRIRKLSRLESIGALLPSCPLAFSHDKQLFNAVCATVSSILKHTEVYHLECLPDADAARLVRDTLFESAEQ